MFKFVKDTLVKMGIDEPLTDEVFDSCFSEFDKDGSGSISREEIAEFIKATMGAAAPADDEE